MSGNIDLNLTISIGQLRSKWSIHNEFHRSIGLTLFAVGRNSLTKKQSDVRNENLRVSAIRKLLNFRFLFAMSQLSKRVLGEFFDIVKRYGEPELRVKDRPGRPWSADELRLKSNTDLHKLWYVLLKERNMLLTMKNLREQRAQKFANPERLDKVKEVRL